MTPVGRVKRVSRTILCGVGAYLAASLLLPPHHVRWGPDVRNALCVLLAVVAVLEVLCWRFVPANAPSPLR